MLRRNMLIWLVALLPLGMTMDLQAQVVIRNAQIIDGAGTDPLVGDVLVMGNRITTIGKDLKVPAGTREIDATGLVLAPGLDSS